MDNAINSKINLLKTQILDKGYDPDEFEQYCENQKQ